MLDDIDAATQELILAQLGYFVKTQTELLERVQQLETDVDYLLGEHDNDCHD